MEAKFLLEGAKVKIYTLNDGRKDEVYNLLNDLNSPEKRSVVADFLKILDRIANLGYEAVHAGWFDSWKEGCEIICEVKKKRFRISCFKYECGQKLLLTTTFIKTKMKEKKEYNRAIRLKKEFDMFLFWRE